MCVSDGDGRQGINNTVRMSVEPPALRFARLSIFLQSTSQVWQKPCSPSRRLAVAWPSNWPAELSLKRRRARCRWCSGRRKGYSHRAHSGRESGWGAWPTLEVEPCPNWPELCLLRGFEQWRRQPHPGAGHTIKPRPSRCHPTAQGPHQAAGWSPCRWRRSRSRCQGSTLAECAARQQATGTTGERSHRRSNPQPGTPRDPRRAFAIALVQPGQPVQGAPKPRGCRLQMLQSKTASASVRVACWRTFRAASATRPCAPRGTIT